MKAGDLERNLTHLVEVAKAARACLASLEGEVSALRLALHAEQPELGGTGASSGGADRPAGALAMEAAYK
ncbi:MAG TPA: hypothetical protein VFU21_23400 [Kofleriaceae bacterium]|nr:hypothetical protein [Kofleriaceae bacterium]